MRGPRDHLGVIDSALKLNDAPARAALAASAVVVAAVVVELDAEARTGSRRSMMTDDSRPNRQLATWRAALQQVAQVILYGEVKTPPK